MFKPKTPPAPAKPTPEQLKGKFLEGAAYTLGGLVATVVVNTVANAFGGSK